MKPKKLFPSLYKEKCSLVFSSVSELCSKFDRYQPDMFFDNVFRSFSIIVRAGGTGLITLSFISELIMSLDKTHILYDFYIHPEDGYCTIYIDLLPYERK